MNNELELKKKLQLRLHDLLDVCGEKGINPGSALLEFTERATKAKKDFECWTRIVDELIREVSEERFTDS